MSKWTPLQGFHVDIGAGTVAVSPKIKVVTAAVWMGKHKWGCGMARLK